MENMLMRIVIYDPYVGKFTKDMEEYWVNNGHEVKRSTYYNPELVEWADVLYFETTDNNILSATNPSEALLADDANYHPWRLQDYDLTNKKVIVRMIDIEVWQQHYLAPKWDVVTDIIFIAPHIRNLVDLNTLSLLNLEKTKIHIIPHSINLDKWTFRDRKPGFNIAIVSERWTSKGVHLLLQVMLKLHTIDSRYKFTWLGQRSDHAWEHEYRDEFVEHHKLPVEFINILNDGSTVDEFLEDKNYLLHGSVKEAFSAAIAEAMAKGIKPVPHRFFGADDIWSGLTWDTIDEAVEMITEDRYDSVSYRQYLIDHGYDLETMMTKFDAIINSKE